MPGMTGYELLKKIKESSTFRKIPVVIMSSENVLARIDRCLEEGAKEYIVKPVKLSDVKCLKDYLTRVSSGCGEAEVETGRQNKRKFPDATTDLSSSSSSSSSSSLSPSSLPSSPSSLPTMSSQSPSTPLKSETMASKFNQVENGKGD